MPVGEDRKSFSSISEPEIRLPPASVAVRYQLIDVGSNGTSSDRRQSSRHAVVGANQSPINYHATQAPTKPPKSVVLTSPVTTALRHAPESVNIAARTTAEPSGEVRTASKSRLRLETILASRIDGAFGNSLTTDWTYHETEQSAMSEASNSALTYILRTTHNSVDNGSREMSLPLTISGENRLRSSSLYRSLNTSVVTATESREQNNQSASTTWLPEVNNTTESGVENRTDAWNIEEVSNSTRSTAIRVRYIHTSLTDSDGGNVRMQLAASQVASITAVCAFGFFFLVAAVVYVLYRRRRTCRGSKVVGSDGRKSSAGDEKLRALRRVAAESDTLSPDLLDQIIRAELARGRAKRYRARLRDGDEQLERLAVELSDDWGTPPPSYRRLTPVGGPVHRRPLWPGDSPARVHDLQPSLPDLPPPIPARSSARSTAVPLDFRQFRRPLPEVPRTDRHEMTPSSFTPKLSNAKTVRCDGPRCDVIAASARIVGDVIRSPLPVAVCTQDGGTGSEKRRRFPKMGRSCLLDSMRQRGDSVDVVNCSEPHFHASQSADGATRQPPSDLRHPTLTSWTRDLSHLPILRDTTV